MRKLVAYLLLSLAFSQTCNAQTLWQGTRVGMSPEQVRAIVPSVAISDTSEVTASGAVELLKARDFVIADLPFNVSFFFSKTGLEQVMILGTPNSLPMTELYAQKIGDALRTKYGAPTSNERSAIPAGGVLVSHKWISTDNVVIRFDVSLMGKTINTVYVYYYPTDADETIQNSKEF